MGEFFVMLHQIIAIVNDLERNVQRWHKTLTDTHELMGLQADEIDELRKQNRLLNANIELYRQIHSHLGVF